MNILQSGTNTNYQKNNKQSWNNIVIFDKSTNNITELEETIEEKE